MIISPSTARVSSAEGAAHVPANLGRVEVVEMFGIKELARAAALEMTFKAVTSELLRVAWYAVCWCMVELQRKVDIRLEQQEGKCLEVWKQVDVEAASKRLASEPRLLPCRSVH
jgi:hypothetical protein